jgi:hypothetical protein
MNINAMDDYKHVGHSGPLGMTCKMHGKLQYLMLDVPKCVLKAICAATTFWRQHGQNQHI